MKSLTSLLSEPITVFGQLGFVYHYHKPDATQAPYAVWTETDEESFNADNAKSERQLNGTIDFYSLTEADSKLDEIETALAKLGATWTLASVQFEEDTNLIHTSWDWSVT